MKPRIINPMPEAIGEQVIAPEDLPQVQPNQKKQDISESQELSGKDMQKIQEQTDQMIGKDIDAEILNEKIRQDIDEIKSKGSKVPAPTSPKDVLLNLIAKGEYKEDREIFGHTWTMKALNQRDMVIIFGELQDDVTTTVGQLSTLAFLQVVYSIEAMDGISVYEWFTHLVKRSDFDSIEEYRAAVRRVLKRYIYEMPPEFIRQFDVAYNEIERNRNKAFSELKKN
ncbi:MAG: hypothetical protein ACTSPI_15760 [Candidatus Heimdallarchaeaceae archaeon]